MVDKKLQNPIFPWVGSKFRIRKHILDEIKLRKHSIFVDVFGGTGTITFNKPPVNKNILNDFDYRIYNFFMCLADKECFKKFLRYYYTFPVSKKIYETMQTEWYTDDDSVKRAFAFYYVQKLSFAGMGHSSFLPAVYDGNDSFLSRYNNPKKRIGAFAEFIQNNILLENRDFRDIIKYYDKPYTLFYCDPPYVMTKRQSSQKIYTNELTDNDHTELVDILLNIKGSCILSGYESEIYTPLLDAGWSIKKIESYMSISRTPNKNGRKRTECLYLSPVK